MGHVSGKYEESRKNRNENAKADVRRQIARQTHECRLAEQILRRSRLRWFGDVERRPEEDWVKKILTFEVASKRLGRRLKKTRMEVISSDLTGLDASRVDAQNWTLWRRISRRRAQANLGDL